MGRGCTVIRHDDETGLQSPKEPVLSEQFSHNRVHRGGVKSTENIIEYHNAMP